MRDKTSGIERNIIRLSRYRGEYRHHRLQAHSGLFAVCSPIGQTYHLLYRRKSFLILTGFCSARQREILLNKGRKRKNQMFPMFKLGGGDKPQGKGIEVKDNS
ncbi:MAG: hypothetical protein K6U11_05925, partial [bacterium]|nr:hypothetical protein [bacterium]